MLDLLDEIGSEVQWLHVPSHIGIRGNERADLLADEGRRWLPLLRGHVLAGPSVQEEEEPPMIEVFYQEPPEMEPDPPPPPTNPAPNTHSAGLPWRRHPPAGYFARHPCSQTSSWQRPRRGPSAGVSCHRIPPRYTRVLCLTLPLSPQPQRQAALGWMKHRSDWAQCETPSDCHPPATMSPDESRSLLDALNLVAMESPPPYPRGALLDSPASFDTASTNRCSTENSRCGTPVLSDVSTEDEETHEDEETQSYSTEASESMSQLS